MLRVFMKRTMKPVRATVTVLAWALCFAVAAPGQESAEAVTVCQLQNDPPAYNHKLVEVTGFVSHDFEEFSLYDPTCPSVRPVWLEYGGKSKSGTMYCCGVTPDRSRPRELVIENIPVPLTRDNRFLEFDRLIQPPFKSGDHGSVVHATLRGRFFAGQLIHYPKTTFWGGYGHMGCCSLLAIQAVESVSPQDRDDLDYGASADQPDVDKTGCGYRILTPLAPEAEWIKAQHNADLGGRAWVFHDPRRVATEALGRSAHVDEASITGLKQTRKAQGRFVYEWRPSENAEPYMVVVSRPYLLSFYAHDSRRVAWVVAAVYVSSCDENSSVTRIK
jgi:hypothetical protein